MTGGLFSSANRAQCNVEGVNTASPEKNVMSTVQNAVDMNLRSCAILSDWSSKKGI